jgi:hypothetical protein
MMEGPYVDNTQSVPVDGIELRDWFAGQALPTVLADYMTDARIKGWDENWRLGVAIDAYEMADEMLKAREVKP